MNAVVHRDRLSTQPAVVQKVNESNSRDKTSRVQTARAVARRLADDQIPGRAAQRSFYSILSVFPMLLILMAGLSVILDSQSLVRATLLERLASVAPSSIVRLFTRLLDHLAGNTPAPPTWGIVVALWAASSGMVAAIDSLNQAYGVTEERAWWKCHLVGVAPPLAMMSLLAMAKLLLAYGVPMDGAFARRMDLGTAFVLGWQIVQWPAIFGFVLLAFDLLHHFASNRSRVRWQWVRPGTLMAIGLWLATSLGLKLCAANFAHYNVAYGSIGAVIVLLLWSYLTSIAILLGAEVNAPREDARRG